MTKRVSAGDGSLADGQFVRRVFLLALVAALFAALWAISEIVLLIFAAVLLAVALRAIAERLSSHTQANQRWSLVIAGAVLFRRVPLWFAIERPISGAGRATSYGAGHAHRLSRR